MKISIRMKPVANKLCSTLSIASTAILFSACSPRMSEQVKDASAGINGGFEQVQNCLPVNWLVYTSKTTGEGDFTISIDSQDIKEGKNSLRLDVKTCSDKGGRYSPGIATEMEAKAGEHYHIALWYKNNGAKAVINISGISAMKSWDDKRITLASGDNWQAMEYDYVVPANAGKIRFELNVLQPGMLHIDDVRIQKTAG